MPFEAWLKLLDFILSERLSLGVEDLPDQEYSVMHESGINPSAAADLIIADNDFYNTDCEDCES